MDPIRDELGGGLESEAPLVQPGVWEVEVGTTTDRGCGDKEVEIEDSRSPSFFPSAVAAGIRFDLSAAMEKRSRSRRPGDQGGGIEKVGLGGTDGTGAPQP